MKLISNPNRKLFSMLSISSCKTVASPLVHLLLSISKVVSVQNLHHQSPVKRRHENGDCSCAFIHANDRDENDAEYHLIGFGNLLLCRHGFCHLQRAILDFLRR